MRRVRLQVLCSPARRASRIGHFAREVVEEALSPPHRIQTPKKKRSSSAFTNIHNDKHDGEREEGAASTPPASPSVPFSVRVVHPEAEHEMDHELLARLISSQASLVMERNQHTIAQQQMRELGTFPPPPSPPCSAREPRAAEAESDDTGV